MLPGLGKRAQGVRPSAAGRRLVGHLRGEGGLSLETMSQRSVRRGRRFQERGRFEGSPGGRKEFTGELWWDTGAETERRELAPEADLAPPVMLLLSL